MQCSQGATSYKDVIRGLNEKSRFLYLFAKTTSMKRNETMDTVIDYEQVNKGDCFIFSEFPMKCLT